MQLGESVGDREKKKKKDAQISECLDHMKAGFFFC